LRTSAALGAGCLLPTSARAEQAPAAASPNIALIVMDTTRADKLGCYGYGLETSPDLDKIANEGVRFDRVVSQCSWTRPAMGSVLASRFPRTLGLYLERDQMLNSAVDTLPKMLKRQGYATFGATANPNMNALFGFDQGFDTYHDSNVVFGWMDVQQGQEVRSGATRLPEANEMFQAAIDWAREHPDTPGYVQINAMEVHEWYIRHTMIRPEYRELFKDAPDERFPRYLQSVRQLSDDVAAFVKNLSAVPGWEDTLFVIMSDHGEGLEEHGVVAHDKYHGWLLYESQVVVPWIMYRKGWDRKNAVVKQPVRLLELLPTVLDCAGLELPDNIDGHSMRPVIMGEEDQVALPDYFVTETHWRGFDKIGAYAPQWKHFHNKSPHRGLTDFELQIRGSKEMGIRTDQSTDHPRQLASMSLFLSQWEAEHPKVPATPLSRELTDEEREALEAVGYLGV
jgi:arylsulfatase A-like enzyme